MDSKKPTEPHRVSPKQALPVIPAKRLAQQSHPLGCRLLNLPYLYYRTVARTVFYSMFTPLFLTRTRPRLAQPFGRAPYTHMLAPAPPYLYAHMLPIHTCSPLYTHAYMHTCFGLPIHAGYLNIRMLPRAARAFSLEGLRILIVRSVIISLA